MHEVQRSVLALLEVLKLASSVFQACEHQNFSNEIRGIRSYGLAFYKSNMHFLRTFFYTCVYIFCVCYFCVPRVHHSDAHLCTRASVNIFVTLSEFVSEYMYRKKLIEISVSLNVFPSLLHVLYIEYKTKNRKRIWKQRGWWWQQWYSKGDTLASTAMGLSEHLPRLANAWH